MWVRVQPGAAVGQGEHHSCGGRLHPVPDSSFAGVHIPVQKEEAAAAKETGNERAGCRAK